MAGDTPTETIEQWEERINAGDLDGLVELYVPDAAIVAEPGADPAHGHDAVRQIIGGYLAARPSVRFEHTTVIQSGDTALGMTRWTLDGSAPDGSPINMTATTSDVFRRDSDGRWRYVIDNPWGTA